jgi:hypothetical protein
MLVAFGKRLLREQRLCQHMNSQKAMAFQQDIFVADAIQPRYAGIRRGNVHPIPPSGR